MPSNKRSAFADFIMDENSPEYAVRKVILETREKLQITQSEIARRTGIDQGDISKLERGTRNPSLKILKRLAQGLDMELRLSFIPKDMESSPEYLGTSMESS